MTHLLRDLRRDDSGVTLLEVLVGMSVTVMLSIAVFQLSRIGLATIDYGRAGAADNGVKILTQRMLTTDIGKSITFTVLPSTEACISATGTKSLVTIQRTTLNSVSENSYWFASYEVRPQTNGKGSLFRITCSSTDATSPAGTPASVTSSTFLAGDLPAVTDSVWNSSIKCVTTAGDPKASCSTGELGIQLTVPASTGQPPTQQVAVLAARDVT